MQNLYGNEAMLPHDSGRFIGDISPIILDKLIFGGRVLVPDPPLTVTPYLENDSDQFYYVIEDKELDVHVFGSDKTELLNELSEQIFFMWDTYVSGDPGRLTHDAGGLAKILKKRFNVGWVK